MTTLQDLEMRLIALELRVAQMAAKATPAASASAGGRGGVATDYEMGGQYGDPVVRKDPPRWTGSSHVGCQYSQCSAEFLDTLAGFLDWQGGKDEEKNALDNKNRPKAPFRFKDAAKARGWAKRVREGFKPPVRQATAEASDDLPADPGDMDIPFATTFDVAPNRHNRRMGRWERF